MPYALLRTSVMAAVCATSLLVPTLNAQEKYPPIRSVTRYQLKFDKVGDLEAAVKEYNAVLRKANSDRYYTIWRALSGESEMVLVAYNGQWADLDYSMAKDEKMAPHRADLMRIASRINACFVGSTRTLENVHQDLSLARPSEPPKMVASYTGKFRAGKLDEALALMKAELIPAVKESGIKSFVLTTTRFGGPTTQLRTSASVDQWADFDGMSPVRKTMGEQKYASFVEKLSSLVEESRWDVYRLDAELSYLPAKQQQ